MKITSVKKDYGLNAAAVDEVSEDFQAFLIQLGAKKKNIILSRLTVEEVLLDFIDRFGEDGKFTYTKSKFLGKPYISLRVEGEQFNPLEKGNADDAFGNWSNSLISNCDYTPSYSYERGANVVTMSFAKKTLNPIFKLIIAIAAAVLVSLLKLVVPEDVISFIMADVLDPLYNAFLGIMATVELPLVFFSVACGILGIGNNSVFGKIGRKMIIRFSAIVFAATAFAAAVIVLLFNIVNSAEDAGCVLKGGLKMLLEIIPKNLADPFSSGNAMQIVLMAIVISISVIILGEKAGTISNLINEGNRLIVDITKNICYLMPFFVFVVILNLIWSSKIRLFLKMWVPIAVYITILILFYALSVLRVSFRQKVNVFVLMKKMLQTFLIGLGTASSTAANGECSESLNKQMGVKKRFVDFGQPTGSVIFMPSTAIGFVVCAIYMAYYYEMKISLSWIIISVFVCSFVAIATPPVPGGAIAAYSLIFTQLNIPAAGVAIMISLDVILDFISTAFDGSFLQLELIMQADSNNMLNHKILRKK